MELMCTPNKEPSVYLREMMDNLADEITGWNDAGVYDADVQGIEHESRSGFIPFTNGGWEGRAQCSFQRGKDFFKCMAGYSEGDYKTMLSEFRSALETGRWKALNIHKGETIPALPPGEMTDKEVWDFYNEEPVFDDGKQLEMFNRKEIGWQYYEPLAWRWQEGWEQGDDDVFFLDFRCVFYSADNYRNESGEDEVYFFAGVNTDFNYGRDAITWMTAYGKSPNQHVCEFGKTVKVSELTQEIAKQVFAEMETTLRNA